MVYSYPKKATMHYNNAHTYKKTITRMLQHGWAWCLKVCHISGWEACGGRVCTCSKKMYNPLLWYLFWPPGPYWNSGPALRYCSNTCTKLTNEVSQNELNISLIDLALRACYLLILHFITMTTCLQVRNSGAVSHRIELATQTAA